MSELEETKRLLKEAREALEACREECAKRTLPEARSATDDGGITQALVEMARENAIEECAKICESQVSGGRAASLHKNALSQAANAIRALKVSEPQHGK